jgi:hypothetical protein
VQIVFSLAVLLLAAAPTADSRGPSPGEERPRPAATRPATSRPATSRPATAPGAADEAGVNPAASAFLEAVGAREDERAYELTTARYREAHPLEEFKKEMEKLRAEVRLRMTLQVLVAPQPADGQPRQAVAVTPRLTARSDRRTVALGLRLAHEDGAWRVADVELLEGNSPSAGFLSAFMKANRGARQAVMASPGRAGLYGRVTKLDEKSLTVETIKRGDADASPAERTLAFDKETRVFVMVLESERKAPGGQPIRMHRAVPGQLSDLKVGQRVILDVLPGQERATRISIEPLPAEPGPGL